MGLASHPSSWVSRRYVYPICIIPLASILGGSRPMLGAASFLAGIFLVYAGSGFLLPCGFRRPLRDPGPEPFALVGMPGAFPYFGAIDQILRADLGRAASVSALLFYNVIFLVPLAALLLVRVVLPARSEAIFQRVASLADRWGRHLIVAVLVSVGAVLVSDGVGWFLGYPLLPVA